MYNKRNRTGEVKTSPVFKSLIIFLSFIVLFLEGKIATFNGFDLILIFLIFWNYKK